jgi:hypothetical protein
MLLIVCVVHDQFISGVACALVKNTEWAQSFPGRRMQIDLLKSIVRTFFTDLLSTGLQPAGLALFDAVEFFYVRFDVEQGCTIQYIDAFDKDFIAFDLFQLYDRQPDMVGPQGRARCEHAPWLIVHEWRYRQFGSFCFMKGIEKIDMAEAVEVLQSGKVLFSDDCISFDTGCTARLYRHVFDAVKTGVYDADGFNWMFHQVDVITVAFSKLNLHQPGTICLFSRCFRFDR